MILGSVSLCETLPFALSPCHRQGDTPFMYESYKHTNRIGGRTLYSGAWITEKR